jgi:hypothetical protein
VPLSVSTQPAPFLEGDEIEKAEWLDISNVCGGADLARVEPRPGAGMGADDDGQPEAADEHAKRLCERAQPIRRVDVLGAMESDEEITLLRQSEPLQDRRLVDRPRIRPHHFIDRVTGDIDRVGLAA